MNNQQQKSSFKYNVSQLLNMGTTGDHIIASSDTFPSVL